MPHITVDNSLPGIRLLVAFSPETATPMSGLATLLLRTNEGLSRADRELNAARVSYLNDCFYCQQSHGANAVCYLEGNSDLVEQVKRDFTHADIPGKLKALLGIAGSVEKRRKADNSRTKSVKRKNLANAVATITSKELNSTAPVQTFDSALAGKIPGGLH